jgi:methylenetetrahydrofolate--tRNA-(uracil-5-)-methyltransferase
MNQIKVLSLTIIRVGSLWSSFHTVRSHHFFVMFFELYITYTKIQNGTILIKMTQPDITIVGGGLAGTEAAWQAAERGLSVHLYEMRPGKSTGAHLTSDLAELICSNSFGSNLPDRASGVLKNELRLLGSLLLHCAQQTAIPAGNALAVDRELFSRKVTENLASHPNIEIIRSEISVIPSGLTIIASGPLTSHQLSHSIAGLTGENHLFFFDAIAPIVTAGSINLQVAFRGARYQGSENEGGDYINCPFTKGEYDSFVGVLLSGERIMLHSFETEIEQGVIAGAQKFFEGCLPVEIIASRGHQALAFGPMRPTGLIDPGTGRWPYAVVQLRQDDLAGSLYNLVGFQTNLTYSEQKRIFHMIPGLETAEFVRYGQMHRNSFLAAPIILLPSLQFRGRTDLFFAGQLTGVEGYIGNIATGLLAGINAAHIFHGKETIVFPETTMLGALTHYITHAAMRDFQPMKANFGILPPLLSTQRMDKRERAKLFMERAWNDMEGFLSKSNII